MQARDALVSNVTRLVVRAAPDAVIIRQLAGPGAALAGAGAGQNTSVISVLENTNVTLECRSLGGQPPPRLAWTLPASLPSFSLAETVTNGSAVSVISALVMRADSGKVVRCRASHSALAQPLETAHSINVLCEYPAAPLRVSLDIETRFHHLQWWLLFQAKTNIYE